MRKNKMMKRVATGLLAAVMLVSGIVVMPKEACAAETTEMAEGDKVWYDEMTVAEFEELYGENEKVAPTKEGYLFAGWYLDEGTTVIKEANDIEGKTKVYAKFVPAYVLSVKSQNYAGTAESANKTNKTTTRVVSTVDESLLYSEVGFEIIINNNEPVTRKTTKVWEKLAVGAGNERKEYGATKIFGDVSKYFFVLNINNIPETEWAKQIFVRPYWITEDGTKVEGLGKYVYVEDGVKGYISVPVNLKNVTEGMAAGVLKVSYDKTRLEFVQSVTGRVFDEMKISAHEDSKIACVGNVSTLQDVTEDDMYITLRFRVTDGKSLEDRTTLYKFEVSAEDFANEKEDEVKLNVWDVQY